MSQNLRISFTLLGGAVLICFLPFTSAHAATVTPISAQITYRVSLDDLSATNTKRLENDIGSLTEDATLSNGGMTIALNNAVAFSNATAGTVTHSYDNQDSNQFGFRRNFSGRVTFHYVFTNDEATEVSIRYLADGSSTSVSTVPTTKWWAMQGATIEVRRSLALNERLDLRFLGVNQITPISYDDTLVIPLPAGQNELYFTLVGDAFGNQPGNRAMNSSFSFQIGDAEPNPVPLPAPMLLLFSASALLIKITRKS